MTKIEDESLGDSIEEIEAFNKDYLERLLDSQSNKTLSFTPYRRCSDCGNYKPIHLFREYREGKHRAHCKICQRQRMNQSNDRNRERVQARNKAAYHRRLAERKDRNGGGES